MARDRLLDALWLLLVGAASSAWCLTAGHRLGPTFDEPFYVDEGLHARHDGSYRRLMVKGTMPLPVDVATLPLFVWERRRGERFENPYAVLSELLPVARAAALPFWWLLLFYGLRWGRALGGPWAGRLAAGLLAVEPNLLGHATLATTDIALTGTVLAAAFHWFTGRDRGWLRRVLVPGVWCGIALACKASALAYVPLLWAVLGLYALVHAGQVPRWSGSAWGWLREARLATVRLRWDGVYAFAVGLAVVFAYCGSDWEPEPTFVAWAHQLPDGPLKSVMVPVAEHLPVFSNAGEGLTQQVKHNFRGHSGGCYIAGQWHPRTVWYYFPLALSMKLPDATLLLLAAVLLLRPRALLSPAGWAAVVLLLFSLNTRVQIGIRLVFPLVAFLYIALAVAVARPASPPARLRARLLAVLSVLCLLWTGAESLAIWPDGLRYVNRLWGGPDRGAELFADSNYDWGQGVPELRRWWEENGRPPVAVWYFGGDPAVLMPPFRPLLMDPHNTPDPGPDDLLRRVGDGYLAVNVAVLNATPDRRPAILALVEWVKAHQPAGRTGTFVIYKLR